MMYIELHEEQRFIEQRFLKQDSTIYILRFHKDF